MRVGVVLLPQGPWRTEAERWRRAEAYGFAHAWTYDHLAWRALADETWHATVPTLVAAATVTERIRLGAWVASPNFRHPVPFGKEVMTLDDVSGGRFVLGLGAGGTGFDAGVLGAEELPPGARVGRLAEFTELLDLLLRQARTTWRGEWYTAVDARMHPGCVQQPRVPFVVAANGPRGMRIAARFGAGWTTTGTTDPAEGPEAWWRSVARAVEQVEQACADAGRDPATLERYLSADVATYSLSSLEAFRDAAGRARELGVTDLVVHWPRRDTYYVGEESVLDDVAADLVALRGPDASRSASEAR